MGQPFPHHSDNGCGAGINLKATGITTLARHAAKWLNANMTELTSRAVDPPPKFAGENYSTPHTRPQRQTKNSLIASCRSLPHFAQGGGVRIVLQEDRTIEGGLQCGSESVSLQRFEIWRIDHQSGFNMDGSGNDNRN